MKEKHLTEIEFEAFMDVIAIPDLEIGSGQYKILQLFWVASAMAMVKKLDIIFNDNTREECERILIINQEKLDSFIKNILLEIREQ